MMPAVIPVDCQVSIILPTNINTQLDPPENNCSLSGATCDDDKVCSRDTFCRHAVYQCSPVVFLHNDQRVINIDMPNEPVNQRT